jgi:TRAP transporter TAXI family solute receptor
MKRIIMLISFGLLILVLATGCGKSDKAPSENETLKNISIGTAQIGGIWYPMGAGMTEVIKKDINGVRANVEETKGAVENVKRINEGNMEIGFTVPDTAYEALLEKGTFSGQTAKISGLTSVHPTYQYVFALKDSGIRKASDLKGKRVALGLSGSSSYIESNRWLKAHGIELSEIKPIYASLAEMVDMLKDNQVDAGLWSAGHGSSSILDLTNTRNVIFIPTEKEALEKIKKEVPFYYEANIPKGMYKGTDQDVPTYAFRQILVVRSDLSEDLVYKITKSIYENLEYLRGVSPAFKEIELNTSIVGMSIPLHPGAEKYYKEKGVKGLNEFIEKMKSIKK